MFHYRGEPELFKLWAWNKYLFNSSYIHKDVGICMQYLTSKSAVVPEYVIRQVITDMAIFGKSTIEKSQVILFLIR